MASKLNISKQLGVSPRTLSFDIKDIKNKTGARISFEDATHKKKLTVNNNAYLLLNVGQSNASGTLEFDIPEHSAQTAISIFATVEEKIGDDYKISSMYSSVLDVENKIGRKFDGDISVSPSFVGPNDKVVIRVKSEPCKKIVVSINDKNFGIITDKIGNGSVSFTAKDAISGPKASVMQKFLVNLFLQDSNYTEMISSGRFLHILPSKIALHADMPNCDAFEASEVCVEETVDNPPGVADLPQPEVKVYSAPYFETHSSVDILIGKSIATDVKKIIG